MKFLCDACDRLAAVSAYRVEAERLFLTCARCGAESIAEVRRPTASSGPSGVPSGLLGAASAPRGVPSGPSEAASGPLEAASGPLEAANVSPSVPSEDPFRVPEGHCPKCIAPVRVAGAVACSQCGLVLANAPVSDYRPPPALAEDWRALLSSWNQTDAHDAFLVRAVAQNELANAGRLYRLRLAAAPDDPFAQRGRDEVLRLASAPSLIVPRAGEPEAPRGWPIWLAFIAGVVVLVSVLMLLVRLLNQAPPLR